MCLIIALHAHHPCTHIYVAHVSYIWLSLFRGKAATHTFAWRIRKSQIEGIQASLAKLLPKICKPQSKAETCLAIWEADFETLRTKGYFQPGLPWKPIPNVMHSNSGRAKNDSSTRTEEIVAIPDVLHDGWTRKDRERAEVRRMCVREVWWHATCLQQIQKEVEHGPSTYSPTEVKRNEFVAICSEDSTENEGLPFWLGKVEKVEGCVVNDDSSGSDDEDIPVAKLPKKAKKLV